MYNFPTDIEILIEALRNKPNPSQEDLDLLAEIKNSTVQNLEGSKDYIITVIP